MAGRTIAIGDVHGDLDALVCLLGRIPALDEHDTLVFLGDYVDRGPASRQVLELLGALTRQLRAHVVTLRGNHEDAWLRVVDEDGWDGFLEPKNNGCRECWASYRGTPAPVTPRDFADFKTGAFFPPETIRWMRSLPLYYEDDHAIYVHAGVPEQGGRWLHPSEVTDTALLLWSRTPAFFERYDGKRMVVGHTTTRTLPPGLSDYTPEDPLDLFWSGGSLYALDTGAGKGGFLTALELPSGQVYESR